MTMFFIVMMLAAAAAVVVWPIMRGRDGRDESLVEDMELGEVLAKRDAALLAIDELEADYQMGNLSETDYAELRRKYEEQAVSVLRSVDDVRGTRTQVADGYLDDEIEAQIARRRQARPAAPAPPAATGCPACGAALVRGAAFCVRCGAAVVSTCDACDAAVNPSDRFCGTCGADLRAVPAE